jgi:DNA-binding transcriptional MerR regulator
MPDDSLYTISELADLAGVTPRTIRYYLAQGLLPSAGQSGPGTRYGEAHLARLRVIRRLQAEHQPLAEIRTRLAGLADEELATLAEQDAPSPPQDSALDYVRSILRETPATYARPGPVLRRMSTALIPAAPTAAQTGDRSQWERIVLAADVELHIRRPLSRTQNKRVDRLVTIARELLEEDPQ